MQMAKEAFAVRVPEMQQAARAMAVKAAACGSAKNEVKALPA
jgi:hypothetical protein